MRERVSKALDALAEGLHPFVQQQLQTIYRERWFATAQASFREGRGQQNVDEGSMAWDAHAVLTVMWDQWNSVFRHKLSHVERSLVNELRDFRNRWAHQEEFDFDDTYRVLDSCERLLKAVDASQAEAVGRDKLDLLRHRFSLEVEDAYRRARERKRRLRDIVILVACCGATLLAIFHGIGTQEWQGWVLALFVMIAFAYVISQRFLGNRPISFTAHECELCGRIIYGDLCPYCKAEGRIKTTG